MQSDAVIRDGARAYLRDRYAAIVAESPRFARDVSESRYVAVNLRYAVRNYNWRNGTADESVVAPFVRRALAGKLPAADMTGQVRA